MEKSCPSPNARQSNRDSNKEKSSKKEKSIHQSNQSASKQIDKPSTRHGTMIDCDNPRYDSIVSNKHDFLRNLPRTRTFSGDEKDNAIRSSLDNKIRMWLSSHPDKPITDDWIAEDEMLIGGRARPMSPISDDNTSDGTGEVYHDEIANRRSSLDRKRSADCPKRIDEDDTLFQVNKKAKQIGEVIEIDSAVSKLKCSARLHPKKSEKIARSRSNIEKTVNEDNSSSSMACNRIATSSSLGTTNTSAITEQSIANCSCVIEFEKKMKEHEHARRKVNVSIEKKKKLPRIIENRVLSPKSRFDPAKIAAILRKSYKEGKLITIKINKDGKEANISNRESNDGKQDAIDKNLDLSDAKEKSLNENSSTKLYDKDKAGSSKSTYTDKKDVDSSLLTQLPQSYRLSIGKHKEDDDDRKSVDLPVSIDDELIELKVVKHDLNFKIREDEQRTDRDTVRANKCLKSVHTYNIRSTDAITSTVPFGMCSHSQSTSITTQNSIVTINRPELFEGSKKIEHIDSILLTKPVNTKTLENVRRQSDRQDLCFVCSGLSEIQIAIVKKFAAKYNANYVKKFNRDVTHVIVNTTGEQNAVKCTLKYLQGIAHQKWIVSYRWIEDCNRQQRLLNEVLYEATTQNDRGIDGAAPRDSRLRERGLFEGFTFWCVGPYDNISLAQYQDLLLATGATVVDSFEIFAKMGGIKGVVVQNTNLNNETIEHWYQTANAAPILVDWIIECIGYYKLLPFSNYILLSSKDCCAIGYPRELMKKDEEDSDDE